MKIIQSLISEVEIILSQLKIDFEGLSWREKVLLTADALNTIKKIGIRTNFETSKISALKRLEFYFVQHAGIVISTRELEVVSGISEYGRRIRELRVQYGYKILTRNSNDPNNELSLKPSEYLLVDAEPDKTAARRWHIANHIRKEVKGGSKVRILKYFLENIGQPLTSEEIFYVAGVSEFGRRIRELRTEEGYPIKTKFTGRPDLKLGEYVLESSERVAEPHDRNIPVDVEKRVYERSSNSCSLCGWNQNKWKKNDPRILELHHIHEHVKGGKNTEENLIVLCSRCHDKIHSGKLSIPDKMGD